MQSQCLARGILCFLTDEIEQEKNEQKDIEHHMRNLKNDMLRLNMLLNKNISSKEQLQQHNQLMESEFIQSLRVSVTNEYHAL